MLYFNLEKNTVKFPNKTAGEVVESITLVPNKNGFVMVE
jgi:hypothetical protein